MQLIKLNKARQALIEAKNLDEIKDILDKSIAFQAYAKAAKMGIEMQNECAEIKIRAERKAGEFLQEIPKEPGKRTDTSLHDTTRLQELGVEKTQSHRWQKIASVPENDFEKHIKKTKDKKDELTSNSVLRLASQIINENTKTPPLPKGEYDVILADPPWQYNNTGLVGMIEKQGHYPTMPIDEICAMKIPASKNAVLFLWVTNPFLEEGFWACNSWGFEYKTNMVWIKRNLKKPGIGFYVRGQHEFLFICIRGSFLPKSKEVVSSIIEADIGEHSAKPILIYNIIERLYPNCKYLELFARNKRENWTAWGNE